MRTYKSPPGILSTISSLIGTKINSIFGPDGPIEAFVQFSKDTKDIGTNAAANARAFFNFARALGMLSRTSGSGGVVSGFVSYIRARGDASDPALTGSGSAAGSSYDTGISVTPGPDGKILDLIGKVEARGNYNMLVGGKVQTSPPLTSMTIQEVLNFQSGMRRRGHESTAVGKYQIINQTLSGRVSAGVVTRNDKFYPSTQDKLAISLKNFRGREKFKQGKISVDRYADNLSKEWASLPYNTGRSFYDKVGSNKSLISRKELTDALKAKEGGLFSGPTSGYPIELHGTELIVPVNSNSILMKLATEAQTANTDIGSMLTNSTSESAISEAIRKSKIDISKIEAISDMFDKIIDAIESTDDIDQKILRYAD
jgi:muramidase (phage lysozyme)